MSTFTVRIDMRSWLNDPAERWNNGLLKAGAAWKSANEKYPRQRSGSSYRRTKTLGHKSDYRILERGRLMDLRSTGYWFYLMYGTGIFGPSGQPIRPVNKQVLAWTATAGPKAGQTIFSMYSIGVLWYGQLETIIEACQDGLRKGVRENAP